MNLHSVQKFSGALMVNSGCKATCQERCINTSMPFISIYMLKCAGQPFNPQLVLNNTVSNIICCLVFGHRFEYNDEKFRTLTKLFEQNLQIESSLWAQVQCVELQEILSIILFLFMCDPYEKGFHHYLWKSNSCGQSNSYGQRQRILFYSTALLIHYCFKLFSFTALQFVPFTDEMFARPTSDSSAQLEWSKELHKGRAKGAQKNLGSFRPTRLHRLLPEWDPDGDLHLKYIWHAIRK